MSVHPAKKSQLSARKSLLDSSPSEQRLQRLRYMYSAMLAKDSTTAISRKSSLVKNDSRKNASLSRGSSNASNKSMNINEPTSRLQMSRALGNVFSNQNSIARSTVRSIESTFSRETEAEKRVRMARDYGNQTSQLNVKKAVQKQKLKEDKIQKQPLESASSQDQSRWANNNYTHEYGVYYSLKNRLILLENQRDQMVRLYGIDAFLDEYTDILEDCWRFETSHANVTKFATGKIGRVLSDFEQLKKPEKVSKKLKSDGEANVQKMDQVTFRTSTKGSTTKANVSKSSTTKASVQKMDQVTFKTSTKGSTTKTSTSKKSENDDVFTSQLTLQDLQSKHRLSESVLKLNIKQSKSPEKPIQNETNKLSDQVNSETGSEFMHETNMNNTEILQLDVSTEELIPNQLQEASAVYLDASGEVSLNALDQPSSLNRECILSAIVEKNVSGVKQDEIGLHETKSSNLDAIKDNFDNNENCEVLEDTLDEEKSIELANDILRKIVTNCVEGMMATTTRRLEIQTN